MMCVHVGVSDDDDRHSIYAGLGMCNCVWLLLLQLHGSATLKQQQQQQQQQQRWPAAVLVRLLLPCMSTSAAPLPTSTGCWQYICDNTPAARSARASAMLSKPGVGSSSLSGSCV